jgi:hypothetical protein
MNERAAQFAIEPLPRVHREVEKFHAESTVLRPFDDPALNGQRPCSIRKEDAQTDRFADRQPAITVNRTAAKRKIKKMALSHATRRAEDDRMSYRISQIEPMRESDRHQDLPAAGILSIPTRENQPSFGGIGFGLSVPPDIPVPDGPNSLIVFGGVEGERSSGPES